ARGRRGGRRRSRAVVPRLRDPAATELLGPYAFRRGAVRDVVVEVLFDPVPRPHAVPDDPRSELPRRRIAPRVRPAIAVLMVDPVLAVRHLSVDFKTDDGLVHAVDDVSFDLARGETLGIVGESGSGKTVTSLALLGLLPRTAAISGEARFDGANLLALDEKRLQPVRGNRIAMIFQ